MKNENILDYYSISMETFINDYLDLLYMEEESINYYDLIHASHAELKELKIPGVKTVPYEIVTISDIMEGKILIVRSGKKKGQLAPYLRPSLVLEKENKNKTF